jgi:preprotein translocase subunit SecA
MDSLRQSIGLRAHGQRDPLLEYKAEAFKIFDELMVNVKTEICHNVFRSASSMMAFENFLRNVPSKHCPARTSAFGGSAPAAADKPASDVVSEGAGRAKAKPRPSPSAPAPKSVATIRAPAAAAKNTSNAAANNGSYPFHRIR